MEEFEKGVGNAKGEWGSASAKIVVGDVENQFVRRVAVELIKPVSEVFTLLCIIVATHVRDDQVEILIVAADIFAGLIRAFDNLDFDAQFFEDSNFFFDAVRIVVDPEGFEADVLTKVEQAIVDRFDMC